MCDEQDRTRTDRPKGDEPLLLVLCNVPLSEGIGIIKHQLGRFKTDAVLLAVCAILLLVPFEWHARLTNSFYIVYVQLSIQSSGKQTETPHSTFLPKIPWKRD